MAVGLVKSPVLWLSVIERIDKPTAIVYTKLTIQQGKRSMKLLLALALVLSPLCIGAATITGQQISTTEWSYTLTFAPLDNYSIFQSDTTITLTGLFGVTSAGGPTSTDFPSTFIDSINKNWTANVLNGGTEVQWTHHGPGTGNFGSEQHVFGFLVFASGASDGLVSLTTSGFSRDVSNPLPGGGFNLDVTGQVAGPVGVPDSGSSLTLLALGISGLAFFTKRSLVGQS